MIYEDKKEILKSVDVKLDLPSSCIFYNCSRSVVFGALWCDRLEVRDSVPRPLYAFLSILFYKNHQSYN